MLNGAGGCNARKQRIGRKEDKKNKGKQTSWWMKELQLYISSSNSSRNSSDAFTSYLYVQFSSTSLQQLEQQELREGGRGNT